MTAALNFLKNAGMFLVVFVVLTVFIAVWWVAAVFHGVNYLTRTRKLPEAGHGFLARWE